MNNKMKNYKQLKLWIEREPEDIKNRSLNLDNSFNKVSILFRNTIPEIPSTTYGTFAIYKYPAKFIPQVIAYVLKRYAKPGMKIFDPFAGYGTAGLVSRVYGYEYELWDLNPIIDVIHETAIMKLPRVNVFNLIKELKNSEEEYIPKRSNLSYWFPEDFITVLSRAWRFAYLLDTGQIMEGEV